MRVGLPLAFLILVALALPQTGEIRARLGSLSVWGVVLVFALQLSSCLAYVAAYRSVMSRRLSWSMSARLGLAVQAANVAMPTGGVGGLALSAWALRRLDMDKAAVANRSVTLFLLTSSVNFATALICGLVLASQVLPNQVPFWLAVVPAAGAACVAVAVASLPHMIEWARRSRLPTRLTRSLAAAGMACGVVGLGRVVRRPDAPALLGAVAYMAFDVGALAAAFWALGGDLPSLGALLLAYVVGQLGGLIPVPGGIGGTDGGLVAALVLYGTSLSAAAAAVLIYRCFQLGLPALLGSAALSGLPGALSRSVPLAADEAAAPPLADVHAPHASRPRRSIATPRRAGRSEAGVCRSCCPLGELRWTESGRCR